MIKDIFKVLLSGASAQLLYLIALPFIARIYGPELYGIYGVFAGLLSISVIVITLRWEVSLIYNNEIDKISEYINSYWVLVFTTSALALFCIAGLKFFVESISIKMALYLVSGALSLGCYSLLEIYLIKIRRFFVLSLVRYVKVLSLIFMQLTIPFFLNDVKWDYLVVSHIASILSSVIMVFLIGSKTRSLAVNLLPDKKISFKGSMLSYQKNLSYLVYNAPQALMNEFGKSMPYAVFSVFGGGAIVGFFSMADRVIRAPLGLISSSVRHVVTVRAVSDLKKTFQYSNKGVLLIFLFIIPITVLVILNLKVGVVLFFGQEWAGLEDVLSALILYAISALFALPYLAMCRAIKLHKEIAIYEFMSLLVKTIVFIVFFIKYDPLKAVQAYSVACLVAYVTFVIYAQRKIKLKILAEGTL